MTIEKRTLEAERCANLVDIVDAWVSGQLTSEGAAKIFRARLPEDILAEIDAIGTRDLIGEPYELPKGGPSVPLDDIEGELEEGPTPIAAAPVIEIESFDENDVEFVITDQAFEPHYGGWNVQFQAIRAPRLAHQSTDPCLEAYVKLDVTPTSRQLASGSHSTGSSLERAIEAGHASKLSNVMLGGGEEGQILRGFTGAAVVEEAASMPREIPTSMPDEALLLDAMRKSLAKHIALVREERARLRVTETADAFIGKRFKAKG